MYDYQKFRPQVCTPEAQTTLILLALRARLICGTSTVILWDLMKQVPQVFDSWLQMAFVDRLIELGFLHEVDMGKEIVTQHRRFRWVEK